MPVIIRWAFASAFRYRTRSSVRSIDCFNIMPPQPPFLNFHGYAGFILVLQSPERCDLRRTLLAFQVVTPQPGRKIAQALPARCHCSRGLFRFQQASEGAFRDLLKTPSSRE